MELFTGLSDDYYKKFFHEWVYNAINVYISDADHLKLDKNGWPIKPGVSASVSLKETFYQNLPSPYSDCQYPDTIDNDVVRRMRNANMSYDRFNCISLCQQYLLSNVSGCYPINYPNLFDQTGCKNQEELLKSSKTVLRDLSVCSVWCPPECEQLVYEVEISYTDFPTRNYAYQMIQDRVEHFERLFQTKNISYDMLSKSVLSIFVYFDDMALTKIVESPSVEFVDLISNIGGIVGLFIGFSVLTLVELIELAFAFTSLCTRYSFKRRQI